MNSKRKAILHFLLVSLYILAAYAGATAQEIFIYRPGAEKDALSQKGKIFVHGEFFAHLQVPSTFPSYNDLSGNTDRWNFGFQNIIHFTPTTRFLAQLYTHDDGHQRTKFDWHFSLRQTVLDNLVLIIGHDSNHDSDHRSQRGENMYFLNRNYIGFGIPFVVGALYFEPFTWFLHKTNMRGHLDFSGEKVKQEYGVRIGYCYEDRFGVHGQIFGQTDSLFATSQTYRASLILRIRIFKPLEISLGAHVWRDIQTSPLGSRQSFYKIMWGAAIPF